MRDRRWGRTITYSPKVFLPVTNLCRNRCDYCSFRRSPGDDGAKTMLPDEIVQVLRRARAAGCAEALLCLGDKPEAAFGAYRATLAQWGHGSTVDYLWWAARSALSEGLLPHTNAGVLTRDEMARLKEVNVSLGLMLETASARLCQPGMAHHRAPDKRPEVRLRMIAEAGELRIPFTTGILVGIGETRRERVEALLAIRRLHREYGHVQEVIVQPFRAHPATRMASAPEPSREEVDHAVAIARLVLDDEVTVQSPPNLSTDDDGMRLHAGLNDLGGISPVTPDFINPNHPWPHVDRLSQTFAREGFRLSRRLAIHDRWAQSDEFVPPALRGPISDARARLGGAEPC
jgi:FO synthase